MDPKTNFRLIIIQTELERFKFLVRSFLRARIKKVNTLICVLMLCESSHLRYPIQGKDVLE